MFDPVPTILVDANVWYSRTQRDWIALLYTTGETDPFRVRWTEDILAEAMYHLRKQHPDWDGRNLSSFRDHLEKTFENGRVADFVVDGSYRGGDPADAHIHAAALACGADMLVTNNARDFEWDDNSSPYEVASPDDFLMLVADAAPTLVTRVTKAMCEYHLGLGREPNLPSALKRAGCPAFAEHIRTLLPHLF